MNCAVHDAKYNGATTEKVAKRHTQQTISLQHLPLSLPTHPNPSQRLSTVITSPLLLQQVPRFLYAATLVIRVVHRPNLCRVALWVTGKLCLHRKFTDPSNVQEPIGVQRGKNLERVGPEFVIGNSKRLSRAGCTT